jgi:hypothetical protein
MSREGLLEAEQRLLLVEQRLSKMQTILAE